MAKMRGIESTVNKRRAWERKNEAALRHVPSPGPHGTLICACQPGVKYSLGAFARHIAGEPMLDSHDGVYVVDKRDPWIAAERDAQARADALVAENSEMPPENPLHEMAMWAERSCCPELPEVYGGNSSILFWEE